MITWKGKGVDINGFDESNVLRVSINQDFYQVDDNHVVSNTRFLEETTSRRKEVPFRELVEMMVNGE